MNLLFLREITTLYPRHLLRHVRTNQNGGRFASHQLRFHSQSHAPHTPEATTSSTALHKPKTTTSLRKAAGASQSIRETQTPTRGAIQPVWTLSTAERYSLPRLQSVLGKDAIVLAESLWIPNLRKRIDGSTGGEAFVFESGCVVSWGVQEEDARRFVRRNMTGRGVELGKYVEEETEEVEFVTDPSEPTRLQGDLIILGSTSPLANPEEILPQPLPSTSLPEETLGARYAFSQALARSTALSSIEVSLEDFLSSVSRLPHALHMTGKPDLPRKEIIQKLGHLLKFRQSINLNAENFADTPEVYWSEPGLEGYFKAMSNALEIKLRTQVVNAKITYAVEVQSVLRDLLTESSTHRMELIIIGLIAVEVVLAFIREGPELVGRFSGRPASERRH